mgnify:CR=1 FL=1
MARDGDTVPGASMGPWLCSHGNLAYMWQAGGTLGSFNGAVAV